MSKVSDQLLLIINKHTQNEATEETDDDLAMSLCPRTLGLGKSNTYHVTTSS